MVITDKPWLAARMRARRDHGRYQMVGAPGQDLSEFKYTVSEAGSNYRMTEMQAAIGRCQLRKLDAWNERRAAVARIYDEELTDKYAMPVQQEGQVYYMYLGRAPSWKRKKLVEMGAAKFGGCPNIGKEPAFSGYLALTGIADDEGARVFSLPVYPTMTDDEARDIGRRVYGALEGM